jgi:hypothetical protein
MGSANRQEVRGLQMDAPTGEDDNSPMAAAAIWDDVAYR